MSETSAARTTSLERWSKATDWPLMAAAVLFLAGYAVPIIDLDLPSWLRTTCRLIVWITWALLAVDYVVRVVLAQSKLRYVVRHWLDLLIIALPLLRPLRLLRLFALLSFLNRRASTSLRGRVAIYVAGGAALLVFCASLAVLDAERSNPSANITNFGEAVWWAVTTMTTVGYGDHYPTTPTGKVVAVGLMIGAVTVLGSVTATFASWLIEHVSAAERAETESLEDQIADLRRLVVQLHGQLAVLTADTSDPAGRSEAAE